MPTVFNRSLAYSITKKVPLLSREDRIIAGKEVAKAYYSSGNTKSLKRVKKEEPDGTFIVLNYPREFRPVMDAIIRDIYKKRIIVPREGSLKDKRKRKPIYSASPLNKQT